MWFYPSQDEFLLPLVGENFQLGCENDDPANVAEIQWYINDTELTDGGYNGAVEITFSSLAFNYISILKINNYNTNFNGLYTCSVAFDNQQQRDDINITVTNQGKHYYIYIL